MLGGIIALAPAPAATCSDHRPSTGLLPSTSTPSPRSVGALSKSAIILFHFWLPERAALTPVSAYPHAAAMVKAGVYLVARLAPGFASLPVWQVMVLVWVR